MVSNLFIKHAEMLNQQKGAMNRNSTVTRRYQPSTVAAKFPMYVVRAVGGQLFLIGAIIMCYNLWMTVRAQPSRAAQPAAVPAE